MIKLYCIKIKNLSLCNTWQEDKKDNHKIEKSFVNLISEKKRLFLDYIRNSKILIMERNNKNSQSISPKIDIDGR